MPTEAASTKQRRHKVPTVLQMEAVECGAASLAMILASYGRWVSLEVLRADCGVSRDGSKASNVLKAARNYGLNAKGFKKEIPQLREMQTPFVVFWNFAHYLVVEGFSKDGVWVNDPAAGRREVTQEEFDESFTGVVLTFVPGPEFKTGGQRPSTWRALRERMKSSAMPLLFLSLASLIAVIPGMASAAYTRVFLDNIVIGGMWSWLHPLILVMCATTLLMAVIDILGGWVTLRFETKLSISESARFFWHVLRLPMDFFAQRYSAEIGSRISINQGIAFLIARKLTGGVLNVMMVVFYAAIMFKYDVFLTMLGVSMAMINLAMLYFLSKKRVDQGRKYLQAQGKLTGVTILGLQSIETIKSGGNESDFFARWAGHHAKVVGLEQELGSSTLVLSAIPGLLVALNTTALLCFGGLRVMQGALSIGMLITFQVLMNAFTTPVSSLMTLGGDFQMMENDVAMLEDVLKNPVDALSCPDDPGTEALEAATGKKLTGYLELRDVVFGYSKLEPPLLPGISLSVTPGQRLALVGGSGSGKSTVARLVAGLNQAWSGEILFDGKTRAEQGRLVICSSVACVDQDISLFEGTITENITLWDDTIDEARVVQAAKDACIHEFITGLKDNYRYQVEEGGRNFSGGQRQRIEIARALIQNPSILILDEATSALDPVTEKTVMDNIRRRGCSCLIIAHRLSTIRDADEIVVLEHGVVLQRGTHEEMLQQVGPYAKLINVETEPDGAGGLS